MDEYKQRAQGMADLLREYMEQAGIGRYFIGGSSLNSDDRNDIDVYLPPDEANKVDWFSESRVKDVELGNDLVQFCDFGYTGLAEMVFSFDFAHVQIGAEIIDGVAVDVYTSANWERAQREGTSFYAGSNNPVGSLMRLNKYLLRGHITLGRAEGACIEILLDIVSQLEEREVLDLIGEYALAHISEVMSDTAHGDLIARKMAALSVTVRDQLYEDPSICF